MSTWGRESVPCFTPRLDRPAFTPAVDGPFRRRMERAAYRVGAEPTLTCSPERTAFQASGAGAGNRRSERAAPQGFARSLR